MKAAMAETEKGDHDFSRAQVAISILAGVTAIVVLVTLLRLGIESGFRSLLRHDVFLNSFGSPKGIGSRFFYATPFPSSHTPIPQSLSDDGPLLSKKADADANLDTCGNSDCLKGEALGNPPPLSTLAPLSPAGWPLPSGPLLQSANPLGNTPPLSTSAPSSLAGSLPPSGPPHQSAIRAEKLKGGDIVYSKLKKIDLRYFQPTGLHCKGTPCPSFSSCSTLLPKTATNVSACWNEEFVDEHVISTPQPRNYRGPSTTYGVEHGHQYAGQVFMLENVFLNAAGRIFDHKHIYETEVCGEPKWKTYLNGKTRVKVFRELATIIHRWGNNYYHGLVEVTPPFQLLLPFAEKMPGLPIVVDYRQDVEMFKTIGVDASQLNLIHLLKNNLYFAHKLFVSSKVHCGHASKSLVTHLRTKVLHFASPPSSNEAVSKLSSASESTEDLAGTKLPDQTSSPRKSVASSSSSIEKLTQQTGDLPEDWKIVLGTREFSRQIVGWAELLPRLEEILPKNRIEIYDGRIPFSERIQLFSKTRFYMGAHGAGLSNIILLPPFAEVLEIMPSKFVNQVFNWLSWVCGIPYYQLVGNGSKNTPLVISHDLVVETVAQIAQNFPST
eukprot:TRINITY_DN573_c1_g1_i2.p1 TRINITY_DN573_c1_g1~~TRINITY_DN573_c1_g1_i2.p1  ORF type:complete len:610 (-),score=59.74 TRINITY_DN573_c1_g1_i2:221-2050(-)